MRSDPVGDAIDANDLDELVRLVDALCDTREWEVLIGLRDRARLALERGRQLWPASSYAEYRLALDAPAEFAAAMLTEDAGHFARGPISEVAASTHAWADLAPHAPSGPVAALAAHQRAVRGETIDGTTVAHAEVLAVPLDLARWEPSYFLPTYRPDRVDEPGPEPIRGRPVEPTEPGVHLGDVEVEEAIRDLVRPWTADSDGHARVVCVRGDVPAALATLGVSGVRAAWVDAGEALALMGWAGASGGRHGRRRGAAAGRDRAWATAGAIVGFDPGERLDPVSLGDAISELRWMVWTAPDVSTGFVLRLAIEDPIEGVAWACDAFDRSDD